LRRIARASTSSDVPSDAGTVVLQQHAGHLARNDGGTPAQANPQTDGVVGTGMTGLPPDFDFLQLQNHPNILKVIKAARSEGTVKRYDSNLKRWCAFCVKSGSIFVIRL